MDCRAERQGAVEAMHTGNIAIQGVRAGSMSRTNSNERYVDLEGWPWSLWKFPGGRLYVITKGGNQEPLGLRG